MRYIGWCDCCRLPGQDRRANWRLRSAEQRYQLLAHGGGRNVYPFRMEDPTEHSSTTAVIYWIGTSGWLCCYEKSLLMCAEMCWILFILRYLGHLKPPEFTFLSMPGGKWESQQPSLPRSAENKTLYFIMRPVDLEGILKCLRTCEDICDDRWCNNITI